MDVIDRKILAVLQEDASLSVAEIGSRVGLSSTPCWKRIQRLEADGRQRHRFGTGEVQKVRHDLSERLGLLSNAFQVRAVLGRQRTEAVYSPCSP